LTSVQFYTAVDWYSSFDDVTNDVVIDGPPSTSDSRLFRATLSTWLAVTSVVCVFQKYGGSLMNPAVTLAFALITNITFHKGD